MNNKYSIQDLASALAERSGMDIKASSAFVKTVFEIVEEYIATDKIVKIKGFGTFKLINVSDRESINVNTGERIVIAGHTKLSFTPDVPLRDAVNRPFSDFETTPLNDSVSTEEMEKIPVMDEEKPDAPLPNSKVTQPLPDTVEETVTEEIMPQQPEERELAEQPAEEEMIAEATETKPILESEETISQEPVKDVIPTCTHRSDENPSYPMASEVSISSSSQVKRSPNMCLYIFVTILLMALSYVGGHFQVLSKLDVTLYHESLDTELTDDATKEEEQLETPLHVEVEDTLQTDTLGTDSLTLVAETTPQAETDIQENEDPAEIAKYFPQVPGGEYWIVGDAGKIHHMQVGETLYRIAGKELGDQNLVRYLIVFNDFEDPNIIHTGDPIRIPKLVRKAPATKK